MQTLNSFDAAALSLADVTLTVGQVWRTDVLYTRDVTVGSFELHVTPLGATPVNLAFRVLGEDTAPAGTSPRLVPIVVPLPDTSAIAASFDNVFPVAIDVAYLQIELQVVSGGDVHVTLFAEGFKGGVGGAGVAGGVGVPASHVVVDTLPTVQLAASSAAIGHVAVDSLPAVQLAAGAAAIGHVIVDTLPAVSGTVALAASSAVVGHVINDAGSAVIGHVIVDSQVAALPAGANAIGTVGVTALPALPAGANVIGHVIVDTLPAVSGTVALAASSAVVGHVINDASAAVIGHVIVDSAPTTLPTGASTAAKQPALGTAGSASTDVLSVQGVASMTPLKIDGSAVTQPVSVAALPALATGTNSIGAVTVALPTTPYHGSVTVAAAGTRVQLATTQALKEGVDIEAHPGNVGIIYVGGVTVSAANGRRLSNGQSIFVRIADLATMYIDASVSGEGASYLGV